jgi:acyl carrier protein
MRRSDITAATTEVFRRVLNNPELELHDDLTAAQVSEWDSLSHITLTVSIEERFRIRFTGKEIRNLKNVGELINLIEKRCSATNFTNP